MPQIHGPVTPLRTENLNTIEESAARRSLAVEVPHYDRSALRPSIVHIGVGGFHRAHLGMYIDELCRRGHREWSIVGSGVMPGDAKIAEIMKAQDHLYTVVVRAPEQTTARVVGCMVDYVLAHPDPTPLIERIASPDTQMVTLTVTEGGYPVDDVTGTYDPQSPLAGPGSAFGILATALQLRRHRGVAPLTVVSCDNIVSNGHFTHAATVGEAQRLDPDLAAWVDTEIAFPNSMVDRITPATTDADRTWLTEQSGVEDRWPVMTEPFTQWVLENSFAGERPPLEALGVILTADVEPYERMKLQLLNAGHSCLAYLAALVGHGHVHTAMADVALRRFVTAILDREAGPVVPPVAGIDLDEYKRSLIERFSNPAIADQIARLCLDGSAKFPKFLLPTVRAQLAADGPVELSALALAGWCRYLQGQAEDGSAIEPAADPMLAAAIGHADNARVQPVRFLDFEEVFGRDLPANPRFVSAFVAGVEHLGAVGVVASVNSLLGDPEEI